MVCPDGSLFSIPPVRLTMVTPAHKAPDINVHRAYSGVTGAISTVTFWGVFAGGTLPTSPGNFLIEFSQPGSVPGAVVTTVALFH